MAGLLWGLLGVAAFSFTVPFTRVAVGGLSPLFIGSAARWSRPSSPSSPWPSPASAFRVVGSGSRLAVVGGGVVVGFPLLTSFALTTAPASHGAVVIALLPAATATMAVLRGHERPPVTFWVVAGVGAVAAMGFASAQWGGLGHLRWSDLLLFGAVLAAAVGYAEGGLLARELGAWQTVSWALVAVLAADGVPDRPVRRPADRRRARPCSGRRSPTSASSACSSASSPGTAAWPSGPWRRSARSSSSSPCSRICWAGLLLGEQLTWTTIVGGLVVILCAGAAVRVRLGTTTAKPTG